MRRLCRSASAGASDRDCSCGQTVADDAPRRRPFWRDRGVNEMRNRKEGNETKGGSDTTKQKEQKKKQREAVRKVRDLIQILLLLLLLLLLVPLLSTWSLAVAQHPLPHIVCHCCVRGASGY